MDSIYIRDLALRCIIGINPDERREKQDVIVNIILYGDLRIPGRTDRIDDAIDYKAIKKMVVLAVEESHYCLLEALAERIAHICLDHPAVESVKISVDKPLALRFARSVGVQIVRGRA